MIYSPAKLKYTLFLDIETATEYRTFKEVPDVFQKHWKRKAKRLYPTWEEWGEEQLEASYKGKGAIFSEYSKVICISVGFLAKDKKLRLKSFTSDDEKTLLSDFADLLINHYDDPDSYYLCGHNIKEFDIPYICRRMVKHGVFMPNMLDIAGKKPWQTEHLVDTMDLWKFGDYKHYTSLELLAAMLGIESPKDDISGDMVGEVYWEDNDLERIKVYCQKDVATVANILLKYADMAPLSEDDLIFLDD